MSRICIGAFGLRPTAIVRVSLFEDAVTDGRIAQGAGVRGRPGEWVVSDSLLPFPVGPGTEFIRHERSSPHRRLNRGADAVRADARFGGNWRCFEQALGTHAVDHVV